MSRRPRILLPSVSLCGLPGVGQSSHDIWTPFPSAAPGNVLEFSGAVSESAFQSAVDSAAAGPLTVRPTTGQSSFTVNGDFTVQRQDLTIQNAVIRDIYTEAMFGFSTNFNTGDGFTITDSTIHQLFIDGMDNCLIDNCTLDLNGVSFRPEGWSSCFLNRWTNVVIQNSSIINYFNNGTGVHCEGLFIGAGVDGLLITNCTFDNPAYAGEDAAYTGHAFFSWFDFNPTMTSPDPQNICVTNSDFRNTINPWFHMQTRPELEGEPLNIRIDTTTCTFDASASIGPLGNQDGGYTAWNLPCSTAV